MKMATPEQPSEPTPIRTNRTKILFQAFSKPVAQTLLSPPRRLIRFLLQTDRPLADRLLPPIGIISILALLLGTIGPPTGGSLKHLWPIAAFTVGGIIFVWFLYRTSREKQNAIFENTFGWLPVFLGALSYGYWYWYGNQQKYLPEKEFFLASAEVLPLLLLAAVVDVRRTERLQSKQLVLPVVAVFLGELAALSALAFGPTRSYSFAAVASSFVSSIVALVLAVMANIAPSEAITLLERTLADRQRVLGADHPDTLSTRNNLALAYQAAGRMAAAITLHEQNLADRQRVLGADHPDTLSTRNNLALAYQAAGRTAAAITLHKQNLADRQRVLGADHPDTLSTRNNLALAYQAAGRTAEAITPHEHARMERGVF